MEKIVAVMRAAGDTAHGRRLRGLIVVLWRTGLRIHEALALNAGVSAGIDMALALSERMRSTVGRPTAAVDGAERAFHSRRVPRRANGPDRGVQAGAAAR